MSLIEIYKQPRRRNYDRPKPFRSLQRKQFFSFPSVVSAKIASLRSDQHKIYFGLVYGYFKAQGKLFSANFPDKDIKFVAEKLGLQIGSLSGYHKDAVSQHKKAVLKLCGFRSFDFDVEEWVKETVRAELLSETLPHHILDDLSKELFRQRIENPLYNKLATILTEEIRKHQRRLGDKVNSFLSTATKVKLEELLKPRKTEGRSLGSYLLTELKYFKTEIGRNAIQSNLNSFALLQEVFFELIGLEKELNLTDKGLKYYASDVLNSPTSNLASKSLSEKYLYLSCFILVSYRKLTDHLAYTLIKATDSAFNQTRLQDQKKFYGQKSQILNTLKFWEKTSMGEKKTITEIKKIMTSKHSFKEKEVQIKAVLSHYDQEQLHKKEQDKIITTEEIKDKFDVLESKSRELQAKVSDVFRVMIWDNINSNTHISEALKYFQDKNGDIDKRAPMTFLTKDERKVFDNKSTFRVGLYKILLFEKAVEGLKNGSVSLLYSFNYKAFENYLIPVQQWREHRLELIQKASIMEFADSSTILKSLETKLIKLYRKANLNILKGLNPHFKVNKKGFSIATPAVEEDGNDSLSVVFPSNKAIDVTEILRTVNEYTGFLDSFDHQLKRFVRKKPDDGYFYAGIVALGCNLGLSSVGQITQQLNESTFETVVEKYFELEKIEKAIDSILSKVEKMPVALLYRGDKVHTSSDGQKYVAINTMLARFSSKYFGKGQGIVADTMITDNYLPTSSKLIAANDREAIYVLDLVKHNSVVQSQIHSTDTHGISNAVYAIIPFFHSQAAPRDVSISSQSRVIFRQDGCLLKDYLEKGYSLAPTHYVDKGLIEQTWDDILRFVCTIKLNYATASQLFRKLHGHQRQHRLSQAINELGQIYRTLHNMEYIDSLEFRQEIENSLNKVEAYNRLASVIFSHNGGEFEARTEQEQEQSEACKRLIISAILCWNYLYLNTLLIRKANEGDVEELRTLIIQGSPLIWKHINLLGRYNFSEEYNRDSVGIELTKIWQG